METAVEEKVTISQSSILDLPLIQEGYRICSTSKDPDESSKRFIRWVAKPSVPLLLLSAKIGEETVGVSVTSIQTHPYDVPEVQGVVDLIYVKKKYRKTGVGMELIKEVREKMKEAKVPKLIGSHKVSKDSFWDKVGETFPTIRKVGSIWEEYLEV